ncbi:MAG: Eco57I restriction-modification methylase domain-containing protein [Hyphomicrobiales bacterium]
MSWLVAVEVDPLAALLLRGNAAVLGLSDRLEVRIEDFRKTKLCPIDGTTLFVGNPPYVRHHGIGEEWKAWFARVAHERGLKASKLAGLHVHFFLKTLLLARPGDLGAFMTAAEWLDVNYGSVLRSMLADGLGGSSVHVLDAAAMPFEDATTTAAITCFKVGDRPEAMRIRSVSRPEELGDLSAGSLVSWMRATETPRWSILVRGSPPPPKDRVELGELFHVHRGQVTGANAVWIHGDHSRDVPRRFLVPAVTRARELLASNEILFGDPHLRLVIDLPTDLDVLDANERLAVERFLAWARVRGADRSYIARHRRAWWSVGLKPPAPILCTYMARRPPAFVRNLCGARHLNVAHGLYPRQPISEEWLRRITSWLSRNVHVQAGRTYAGGLTRFEPGEVERIPVPDRWQMAEWENAGDDVQQAGHAAALE